MPALACALRCDSGRWGAIDDGAHQPIGVAKVETMPDRVRVHHAAPLTAIHGCSCDTDETYAKAGLAAGASVGLDYTDVFITDGTGKYRDPATLAMSYSNVWLAVWGY